MMKVLRLQIKFQKIIFKKIGKSSISRTITFLTLLKTKLILMKKKERKK